MKKLNVVRLGLLFAGCFLGAGYVSGQELRQYFVVYGAWGYVGLFVAIALLYGFGVLCLRMAQKTGLTEVDEQVLPWKARWLHVLVMLLESLFLFALVTIMCAGVGALGAQLFGLPHWLGGGLFAALVLACALAGLQSIVSAFSVSVPLLVLATLGFGIAALCQGRPAIEAADASGGNALLGGWFFSAVNYACYNILSTLAILGPFGPYLRRRSTVYAGLGLGAALLAVIALSVMLSLQTWGGAQTAELPMLSAAAQLGIVPMYLYALLLFAGMFGSALSNAVAFVGYCCAKFPPVRQRKTAFTVLTILLAYLASLFGFSDLIRTVYPVFGYASAAFLAFMLLHAAKLRRAARHL